MSVEGMGTFRSGNVSEPADLVYGGIVTLETGRVFGGDTAMAYKGSFQVSGSRFKASVRVWNWNDRLDPEEWSDVFHIGFGTDLDVILEAQIDGETMTGSIYRAEQPDTKLVAQLTKVAELP